MSIIETQGLRKHFDVGNNHIEVLKGIDMQIEEGKLVILMGPSGSGKTTLINQLSLLDTPSSGQLMLLGKEVKNLSDKEKDHLRCKQMGLVFQSVALISKMSAFENIDFFLRMTHYPDKKREERVKEVLHLVGLEKRRDHMSYQLSGGEQQRVAIARAIAHRPSLIFADEPTAELDSETGLKILRLFLKLVEKEGTTILMSSHDPAVELVAHQIFHLKDGQLEGEYGKGTYD